MKTNPSTSLQKHILGGPVVLAAGPELPNGSEPALPMVTQLQDQLDFSRTDLVFTDYNKLYCKGAFCQQTYFPRSVLATCKNKTLLI